MQKQKHFCALNKIKGGSKMKKLLGLFLVIALCLCLFSIGNAAPFITTNPQSGIMSYQLSGTGVVGLPTSIAAQTDGSLRLNIGTASVGSNTVNISACSNTDAVWGVLCSPALPFTFTRPGVPSTPSGVGLVP
jgi:hypothetical protein